MSGKQSPPDRVAVRRLKLTSFRNYASASLDFEPGAIVFAGENGAGKTNLLEALSLLSPGRGLRRATFNEMAHLGSASGFAVHCRIQGPDGETDIGTGTLGLPQETTGREVRINGTVSRSADDLLEYTRVVWLTPAMDGLFTGPAGDRRRFLDRLVLAIDPSHGRRALDYEKATRGRNRLLGEDSADPAWLDAIEAQIAEHGVAIAAARNECARLLDAMIGAQPDDSPFPKAGLAIEGETEDDVRAMPATDAEDRLRSRLRSGRHRDRAAGRTLDGPHRSDLKITHVPKSMPAGLCSTGEQKALLTGIVLAHARLVATISGMTPVILLDEIGAHLDANRRAALFEILEADGAQTFMTGTDHSLFSALSGRAQFFTVGDGKAVLQRD